MAVEGEPEGADGHFEDGFSLLQKFVAKIKPSLLPALQAYQRTGVIDADSAKILIRDKRNQDTAIRYILALDEEKVNFFAQTGFFQKDTPLINFFRDPHLCSGMQAVPTRIWRYMQSSGLWQPNASHTAAYGFTVPDWRYLLDVFKHYSSTIDEDLVHETPPLLWALGAHEKQVLDAFAPIIKECYLSNQIQESDDWLTQFDQLFNRLIETSAYAQKLRDRGEISDVQRSENALKVNQRQIAEIRSNSRQRIPPEVQRVIDDLPNEIPKSMQFIEYVRRNRDAERMDRFAAAIYAKTMQWAVDKEYSRLFSSVGLVPRVDTNVLDLAKPASIMATVPQAQFYDAFDEKFLSLAVFNRFFAPTHSNVSEFQLLSSTPIITYSTWCNTNKLTSENPFVLIRVDYDQDDPGRKTDRLPLAPMMPLDASSMVDDFLAAIDELEILELNKSRGE